MYENEKRVAGVAQVGDVVRYWDIANQSGRTTVVVELPEFEGGCYKTRRPDAEFFGYSDLRQHGWSFAEDSDVSVSAVTAQTHPEFFKK